MKELGLRIKLMGKENYGILMAISMKEIGEKTGLRDSESMFIQMVLYMKAFGQWIGKKVKVKKFGLMEQNMRVPIIMVKKKVMVF